MSHHVTAFHLDSTVSILANGFPRIGHYIAHVQTCLCREHFLQLCVKQAQP